MKSKSIFAKLQLNKLSERFALIALGVVLGFLVLRFTCFEFEWKFNVINFLTILLTFVVTFHFQQLFNRRSGDDRIEKNLIIEQVQRIRADVAKIGQLCRDSTTGGVTKTETRAVIPAFKNINREIGVLRQLCDTSELKPAIEKLHELQRSALSLKQLVTGGGFPQQKLPLNENAAIQLKIQDFSATLVALILYVNRL